MADIVKRSNRVSLTSALERIRHVAMYGMPMVIIGAPGSAKSACAIELAQQMQRETADFGGCLINASNKEAPHIYGFQKISEGPLDFNAAPAILQPKVAEGLRGAFPVLCPDHLAPAADGSRHPIASMPVDLQHTNVLTKSMLVPYSSNLVIIDEFTKIQHESVMGTLAGVAHDAMFGEWSLPKDTTGRVFIGNDIGHQSFDVPIPAHFVNRCMKLFVYLDYAAIENYWMRIGMDPLFMQFAKENTSAVFSETVPVEPEPFSTCRSFTLAWKAMTKQCEHMYEIDNIAPAGKPYRPEEWPFYVDKGDRIFAEIEADLRATMAAYCGEAVALAFADYALKWHEMPRMADILADPNTAKMPVHPGHMDAVLTMCAQEASKESLSTIVAYIKRMERPHQSVFCSKIKQHIPTVAPQNRDFMELLNKSGAVGRFATFGNN